MMRMRVALVVSGLSAVVAAEPLRVAPEVTAQCVPFYPASWQPLLGQDKNKPASSTKPERGKPFADAWFKTCVTRVTDHAADQLGAFVRNDYSRRQGFNSDNTRIVVEAQDGSWHLYDATTYKHVKVLPGLGGDAEPQWNPTKPNLMYYLPTFGIGMKILEIDINTGRTRVAADLAARIKAIWPRANNAWTKAEGSPSADARYWALMVDDPEWNGLGLIVYDLVEDKLLAHYDYAQNKKGRPDHVSMSPSGNYVVPSWDDGTWAYSRDFKTAMKLHPVSSHSDLALDTNGDDVYVAIDYDLHGGPVFMINLRTGARTTLFMTYLEHTATNIHFSGKAFKRPGWVLVSAFGESGKYWEWMHGKIFALELKDNPRIVNLAHHHGLYDEYFTEPHASVNRDFTRVVFNSTWDIKTKTDIDVYTIELPKRAIPTP
jgi:hypothetical protein